MTPFMVDPSAEQWQKIREFFERVKAAFREIAEKNQANY